MMHLLCGCRCAELFQLVPRVPEPSTRKWLRAARSSDELLTLAGATFALDRVRSQAKTTTFVISYTSVVDLQLAIAFAKTNNDIKLA